MRINVYTEELLADAGPNGPKVAEIVTAEYISSRTGLPISIRPVNCFSDDEK